MLYVSIHALLAECDRCRLRPKHPHRSFNPRTPCGVRPAAAVGNGWATVFQSTHSLRSATPCLLRFERDRNVSIHALLAECDGKLSGFAGIQPVSIHALLAECDVKSFNLQRDREVSIHALLAECDFFSEERMGRLTGFNPRTPCGVRPKRQGRSGGSPKFQSTHSLRSATAPDLIHCYSTEQIILCANLPKKTVIARLLFLSIYLSIFYSQCITPIADLPGNSCELEVGAQAMFNSL